MQTAQGTRRAIILDPGASLAAGLTSDGTPEGDAVRNPLLRLRDSSTLLSSEDAQKLYREEQQVLCGWTDRWTDGSLQLLDLGLFFSLQE